MTVVPDHPSLLWETGYSYICRKQTNGPAHKFAHPFSGPYRILELTPNDAKVRPVDRPAEEPIFISLDRVRYCPNEVGDTFWPPRGGRKQKTSNPSPVSADGQDSTLAMRTDDTRWTRHASAPASNVRDVRC